MKLQEALKGLICEICSVDSVVNAIKNKQKVIIYYDGDEPGGRGTGIFLDVYNNGAGTIEDIVERKNTIVKNKFNSSKTYPNF